MRRSILQHVPVTMIFHQQRKSRKLVSGCGCDVGVHLVSCAWSPPGWRSKFAIQQTQKRCTPLTDSAYSYRDSGLLRFSKQTYSAALRLHLFYAAGHCADSSAQQRLQIVAAVNRRPCAGHAAFTV